MIAMPRHLFRFTIGQGMASIAALAVIFAFLPMPAAVGLALLMISLVLLRRNQPSHSILGETIGCLSCFIGFIAGVGAILCAMLANPISANDGLSIMSAGVRCGIVGAIVAGIVTQLTVLALQCRTSSPELSEAKHESVQAEIELVKQLLNQGENQSDEEVRRKLEAYQARLNQER
jgi:hypothetical protein